MKDLQNKTEMKVPSGCLRLERRHTASPLSLGHTPAWFGVEISTGHMFLTLCFTSCLSSGTVPPSTLCGAQLSLAPLSLLEGLLPLGKHLETSSGLKSLSVKEDPGCGRWLDARMDIRAGEGETRSSGSCFLRLIVPEGPLKRFTVV